MPNSDSEFAAEFEQHFRAGNLCVHPTDTIPGLTFDPTSVSAARKLLALKGYSDSRPFVGLVPSVAAALALWHPLPDGWAQKLSKLWPCALTVVWRANASAPPALVAADGTIALRYPQLPDAARWLNDVMERVALPLPSTSINRQGASPCTDWQSVRNFISGHGVFLPPETSFPPAAAAAPSTIIALKPDGSLTVVRQGSTKIQ